MKSISIVLSLLFLSVALHAQNPSFRDLPEEAVAILQEGIRKTDAGELDDALEVYRQGATKYPDISLFQYEEAYVLYLQKNFDEAIELLEEVIESKNSTDQYYMLLGNAYDMSGDPEKAVEIYQAGLEHYPESGFLYLELGTMAGLEKEYEKAVMNWEAGLTVQPSFSSNYFHAARMFMASPNRGWGILYGEIFLNLEFSSERSMSMRDMMWRAYNDAFESSSEHEVSDEEQAHGGEETFEFGIHLFQNSTMYLDEEAGEMYMPFSMIFEQVFMMVSINEMMNADSMSVAALHRIRSQFLDAWFSDSTRTRYLDIGLFNYLRELKGAGLLEAYDHFLVYCEATQEEIGAWDEANPGKFEQLSEWLAANPYSAEGKNALSRRTIKGVPLGAAMNEEE